jgi:uncharacterized membrane protein
MNLSKLILPFSVGILVVMQGVGLFGMVYGNQSYFVQLTALNLCITSLVFLLNSTNPIWQYTLAFISIALGGFFIEVLGVKTQIIFGTYWYGPNMGTKLWDVPLVMGFNWGVLILSCAAIAQKVYTNLFMKAIAGASLMVLLDLLIEPLAMKLGYWYWDTKQIPLQNYVAWWVISFVMLLFVFNWLKNPLNKLGAWAYGVQFMFFCLLHLLL